MRRLTLALCCGLVVLLAQSAPAQTLLYTTFMDGPSEDPPNASPGVGTSLVTFDLGGSVPTMRVQVEFSGLVAPTTLAHIHCCADPPANTPPATPTPTFPGFPAGVTSGSYDMTFDMSLASSYNSGFMDGSTPLEKLDGLLAGMDAGQAYLNIHTDGALGGFPGGEIRGFYAFVPEPSTAMLAAFGLLGLLLRRRR